MSKGVKKQWGKSKKEISFQANQRDFFPVWSEFFPTPERKDSSHSWRI